MDINKIFEHNKEWVKSQLSTDKNYFKELSKAQTPEILYIGCSDSRIKIGDLLGLDTGRVFIHRNIANMIPNTDLNVMSVINYAINHLKVKHIIVCGHYNCGGIKAGMQSKDLGILNPWLRNIRDVYRLHRKELDAITCNEKRYDRLVELNVQEQCINLLKASDVQLALSKKQITIHGWVFDIYNGKLIDLKIDFDHILEEIMEIYHLHANKK